MQFDEREWEQIAQVMNYAYRHSSNRENAIALAMHHEPMADITMLKIAWECIDAYVDDDQQPYLER